MLSHWDKLSVEPIIVLCIEPRVVVANAPLPGAILIQLLWSCFSTLVRLFYNLYSSGARLPYIQEILQVFLI